MTKLDGTLMDRVKSCNVKDVSVFPVSRLGQHKDPECRSVVEEQREGVRLSSYRAGRLDTRGRRFLQEEPQWQEASLASPHVQRHRECNTSQK